jgi:hypothetical protein
VFCIWHDPAEGWVIVVNPGAEAVAERDLGSIAWTWYPLIGAAITVTVGGLMSAARQLAVQRRSAGRSEEAP